MGWTRPLAAAVTGYVAGTFPTADLVARRATGGDVDLHRAGTGNPGAANALATLGPAAGAQVLVGDVGKGLVACALGGALGGPLGAHVAGTAAVAGHCYPATRGFRGGKGVAASVGQCLATFPAYFPIDVAVAVATAAVPAWKRRAFTATVVSSVAWIAGGVVGWRRGWSNPWGPPVTAATPLAALVSTVMILERFTAAERRATKGSTRVAAAPADR